MSGINTIRNEITSDLNQCGVVYQEEFKQEDMIKYAGFLKSSFLKHTDFHSCIAKNGDIFSLETASILEQHLRLIAFIWISGFVAALNREVV